MDLMSLIIVGVIIAVAGGLLLDRIRGVAGRAEGRMARALRDLPHEADRERWMEEFRQLLSEYEGRPFKQYRESREQIRAANGLARVYARPVAKPADQVHEDASPEGEMKEAELGAVATRYITRAALAEALQNLSYRERRILELRHGLDGQGSRTLDEVGRTFNVTTERIRQIEIQSLKKLQSLAEAQKLREID
jgi:RNA polymerase sigma factor (sigma-70 family)